ncbi:MAG: ATP-dependent Clp protease adaptor ClpS [Phycisphaerales bacterium]|nr:ATP-dependent Clp protease adaptor ClpS [Phycisphaerales bacterium]
MPATETRTETRPETSNTPESESPKQWNVVLHDDQDHSYDYVIRMMQDLFRHTRVRGMTIAREVDATGRAICLTTHREHAELKRDQIHAFGKDILIARCAGSMRATIEPVE